MRHRKKGRILGRAPSHRKALYRNMLCALVLTERDAEFDDNAPKVKGRIVTTLPKAKEIRPMMERLITIAKKGLVAQKAGEPYATDAERNSEAWKKWRESDKYKQWVAAVGPAVTARRRCFQVLQDKQAVRILFDVIAPRFVDRPGGYTRILKLAKPRLGDAGQRAALEFVGKNDRAKRAQSLKPEFSNS